MSKYSLTTWSADRLVRNEPIVAAAPEQAIAFVQGILTERTREHGDMLMKLGVRYILEECHRATDELTILAPNNRVGTWHLWQDDETTTLMWETTEPSWEAIGSDMAVV
ncbi:MAG: hypothetical protein PSV22_12075 [Pseudolabrys sp.]|nr:hypothetical protein [Pseudolabrys sp.]